MATAAGFQAMVIDLARDEIDGMYDYVTCFEALEHIPDAEIALLRLKRAARQKIIVSVPNVGYISSRLRLAIFGRFPLTNCVFHINEHVRHWTPKDFAEWAEHHGLSVDQQAGQYGVPGLWERWPSLFAAGMVYVLSATDVPIGRHGHMVQATELPRQAIQGN
jgi:hypothetical protein